MDALMLSLEFGPSDLGEASQTDCLPVQANCSVDEANSMSTERRRSTRRTLSVSVECRVNGEGRPAVVRNISKYGCSLELADLPAVPGEKVLLKLSEVLVLPATVTWTDKTRAGLTFRSPMFGSMLQQFALRERGQRL
jgi:hypothetical protein